MITTKVQLGELVGFTVVTYKSLDEVYLQKQKYPSQLHHQSLL